MLSTWATDALVLKHKGISIHSGDEIVLNQFNTDISTRHGLVMPFAGLT